MAEAQELRDYISEHHGGNKTHAAEALNVNRVTIWNNLNKDNAYVINGMLYLPTRSCGGK